MAVQPEEDRDGIKLVCNDICAAADRLVTNHSESLEVIIELVDLLYGLVRLKKAEKNLKDMNISAYSLSSVLH